MKDQPRNASLFNEAKRLGKVWDWRPGESTYDEFELVFIVETLKALDRDLDPKIRGPKMLRIVQDLCRPHFKKKLALLEEHAVNGQIEGTEVIIRPRTDTRRFQATVVSVDMNAVQFTVKTTGVWVQKPKYLHGDTVTLTPITSVTLAIEGTELYQEALRKFPKDPSTGELKIYRFLRTEGEREAQETLKRHARKSREQQLRDQGFTLNTRIRVICPRETRNGQEVIGEIRGYTINADLKVFIPKVKGLVTVDPKNVIGIA